VNTGPQLLLAGAVAAVGVLHTIVPDHWVPITLIARQRGWSRRETAAAALRAGVGHALSTLAIGAAVWLAGVAVAERFGHLVDIASSLALVGFGGWIALSAWRELRLSTADGPELRPRGNHGRDLDHGHAHHHGHSRGHAHRGLGAEMVLQAVPAGDPLYLPLRGGAAVLTRHAHSHRHGGSWVHAHWHDHIAATDHPIFANAVPVHAHRHKTTGRTALLLILGSSPMVEGIPLFFAAARYGAPLVGAMAVLFAASTIATYVLLCVSSTAGLQRLRFGAVERYGEVLSGAFIALVGLAFWLWPAL
jgi:nickel/cobalt transporter (NicO) family protein